MHFLLPKKKPEVRISPGSPPNMVLTVLLYVRPTVRDRLNPRLIISRLWWVMQMDSNANMRRRLERLDRMVEG
jgi:hypothetical protein